MKQTLTLSEAGRRLDAAVADALGVSNQTAKQWLQEGRVKTGERCLRKGDRTEAGMTVEVDLPDAGPALVPCPEVALTVLYEDEDIVVTDKPAGLPSHPLRPGEEPTAAGALVARFPECRDVGDDPREGGLVHRLDTETTGALIAARSRQAWLKLRQMIRDGHCEKSYLIHVFGIPADSDTVAVPLGRAGHKGGRIVAGAGRGLMPAETTFRRLAAGPNSAFVEARLYAGRPHQVRVHASYVGHPVLGDARYGDDRSRAFAETHGITALRLHAATVTLPDHRGQTLHLEAPPPPWVSTTWP